MENGYLEQIFSCMENGYLRNDIFSCMENGYSRERRFSNLNTIILYVAKVERLRNLVK